MSLWDWSAAAVGCNHAGTHTQPTVQRSSMHALHVSHSWQHHYECSGITFKESKKACLIDHQMQTRYV